MFDLWRIALVEQVAEARRRGCGERAAMFGNVMGTPDCTLHAWSPRIILGPLSSVRYPSSVIGVSIIVLDMATDVLLDRLFNSLKSLASSTSQPASGLQTCMPGFGKQATDCKKVQTMPTVN